MKLHKKDEENNKEKKEEPIIVEENGVVTVRENGVVIAISKSVMNVPELCFNKIGIKWYEDKKKES